MAKYDPLSRYLKRQKKRELSLSFREIECMIGAMLPNCAAKADWWSNEAAGKQVQLRAWREAGYEALLIAGEDRVEFRPRQQAWDRQIVHSSDLAGTELAKMPEPEEAMFRNVGRLAGGRPEKEPT